MRASSPRGVGTSRPPSGAGKGRATATRSPSGRHAPPERAATWVVAVRNVPTASVLLGLVGVLCAMGLVMVGSASSVISLGLYGSPWAILIREVMWMAIGTGALFFACRFDYRKWRQLRGPMLLVTFVLLFAVLVPGLGVHASGSSRWIGFGQFRVQPSEMMKLALAVFGADLVVRRREQGATYRTMVGPLLLVAGLAVILILAQPDMGTALVVGCVTMALLFGSGVSMGPVLKLTLALALMALMVGIVSPYRRARLLSFLDPGAHQSGSGYQVVQSLIGLGSGHLFGLGLGAGRQKWGLLPNAHTDFIFSVIGEELGLVGAVAVLLLLGGVAWFGLRAASRAPDEFGSLLAMALVAWILSETVINVGAVIGMLPVTGIPLPFISFGGSSLVITMLAAGILVNIARHERLPGAGARRPSAGLVVDQHRQRVTRAPSGRAGTRDHARHGAGTHPVSGNTAAPKGSPSTRSGTGHAPSTRGRGDGPRR